MNRFNVLAVFLLIGVSACGGGESKKSSADAKPNEQTETPVKEDKEIPPTPKEEPVEPIQEPRIEMPENSFEGTEGENKKEESENNDDIIIYPQNHKNGAEDPRPCLVWTAEDTAQEFRTLSDEEFARIQDFDIGTNVLLDCTITGAVSIKKRILATPKYLVGKENGDGFTWKEEIKFNQDIGERDYSWNGAWNWVLNRKPQKTETVDVFCNRLN